MGKKTDAALKAIQAALIEQSGQLGNHETRLDRLEKVVQAQAQEIARLEDSVTDLRNEAIKSAIARGVPSKVVAQAHGLSAGRISQIAPRNKH